MDIHGLSPNHCSTINDLKEYMGTYKPTHVVMAITYGGNAHIVLEQVYSQQDIYLNKKFPIFRLIL